MGWLGPHRRAVVEAATARLVPGPQDDPAEASPGAREAGVVEYVDSLLSSLDDHPLTVLLDGPRHRRTGDGIVALTSIEERVWRERIADLRDQYAAGVTLLDELAGGDFSAAEQAVQDEILAREETGPFLRLLFEHTVEGMYGDPAYGGNRSQAGWRSIGFRGPVQPHGFSSDAVPLGMDDPIDPALLEAVLAIIPLPLERDPREPDDA